MKKIAACIIFCILLSVAVCTFALASDYFYVTGCNEWVSLREEPRTNSDRILKIPLYALVTYLNKDIGDFSYVSYGGNDGYVLKEYLSPISSTMPMYVANCNEYINLRSEPTTYSESLVKIPLGEQLECAAISDEKPMVAAFYQDSFSRMKNGYVLSEYLSFIPDDVLIESATMIVSRYNDQTDSMTIVDTEQLNEIASIVKRARPGYLGNCPLGAQFILTFSDASTVYFMYPTDGCDSIVSANGSVYGLQKEDNLRFLELFSDVLDLN